MYSEESVVKQPTLACGPIAMLLLQIGLLSARKGEKKTAASY